LQEATVGVEHQVSPYVAIAARYIHKQLDQAVEDIGLLDANHDLDIMIGNPGFHRAAETFPGVAIPKAVRDYDALEFIARKLFDRNWAVTASYVWSRLYGNYPGISESDEYGLTTGGV